MKKLFLGFSALILLTFSSCIDDINDQQESIDSSDLFEFRLSESQCGSMEVLNKNLASNPDLAVKMQEIENHTARAIANQSFNRIAADGVLEIPVVFHIIYRTQSENISLTQINSQIDALNEDFNLNNPGRNIIPSEFTTVEADINIRFVLENVIRVQNSKTRRWRPNDSMKFASSGGSDVVNPQEFLNIWVVNNMPYHGGNILGYAQFPGGNWNTDGVVMDYRFTGDTSYSTGRTATHEVGHWLNLRHIWGDGGCGVDDFVADTPTSDRSNTGCPSYPTVHCGTNDMTMNFMDYSSDQCLNMFTEGQKARMLSVFASGGFRTDMAD
ncbi:MAG: hypothetical protein ACJAR4_001577 [Psychroserpens sp.]|jgi:hypothetical protein